MSIPSPISLPFCIDLKFHRNSGHRTKRKKCTTFVEWPKIIPLSGDQSCFRIFNSYLKESAFKRLGSSIIESDE